MNMIKMIENRLIEEFQHRGTFSKDELFAFFKNFEPELSKGTLGWRIYDLNNKSIIKPLKRGIYTISNKQQFSPAVSHDLLTMAKKINKSLHGAKYCIWETNCLNVFSQHQSVKNILIIETEKENLESFFYEIKENNKADVFPESGRENNKFIHF